MRVTSVFAVLAIASLSACGGSSTGSTSSSGSTPTSFDQLKSASTDQLRERGEALLAEYDTVDDTTLDQMSAQTGTATYAGVTAFGETPDFAIDDAVATSAISLTADFGADTISGEMTNFYAENDVGEFQSVAGTIAVNGGVITDTTFTANISGDLVLPDGTEAVTGTLDGGFIGDNADAVEGDINATVGTDIIFGGYIAERQ